MASKKKTITVGGKTRVVQAGSNADKKYSGMKGAVVSTDRGDVKKAQSALNTRMTANNRAARSTQGGLDNPNDRGINPTNFGPEPTGLAENIVQNAPTSPTTPPQNALGANAPVSTPTGANAATAPVATGAAAPTPTQNKYQTALGQVMSGGAQAPQDPGAARSAVSSYRPAPEPDTSVVDNIFSQDPVISQLMTGIGDLLSSKNQVPSIMDDYRKLRRQSGLDDINEEMIDAETILDGTEDDIRNEIQVAGGFGTESQVQAMTLARNKGLLKRYNQLVQMKTDATNQLNTMLTLTQQDRQMAQERVNTQISAMFNMANFRQTALQNTRQQYQWMATQMGADGLYNSLSQDPRQLAMAEQILGTGPGGLQKMGQMAAAEKARQADIDERQIRATESNAAQGWARLAYDKAKDAAEAAGASYQLANGTYLRPYNGELTNQEQAKIRDIEVGEALVNQMEKIYYGAVGNGVEGASARPRGLGRVIGAAIGTNQPYREYQNFIASNLAPIAKGLKGEVGAITDSDKKNALAAFPNAYTSRSEAEAAFTNLRQQLRDQKGSYGDIIIPI